MKNKKIILVSALTVALTACGGSDSTDAKSVKDFAHQDKVDINLLAASKATKTDLEGTWLSDDYDYDSENKDYDKIILTFQGNKFTKVDQWCLDSECKTKTTKFSRTGTFEIDKADSLNVTVKYVRFGIFPFSEKDAKKGNDEDMYNRDLSFTANEWTHVYENLDNLRDDEDDKVFPPLLTESSSFIRNNDTLTIHFDNHFENFTRI